MVCSAGGRGERWLWYVVRGGGGCVYVVQGGEVVIVCSAGCRGRGGHGM